MLQDERHLGVALIESNQFSIGRTFTGQRDRNQVAQLIVGAVASVLHRCLHFGPGFIDKVRRDRGVFGRVETEGEDDATCTACCVSIHM